MAAAAKSAKAMARATDLLPVIAEVRAAGVATLSGIAKALTARGVPTPSGPRRLESAAGSPGAGRLKTRATPAEPCTADRRTLRVLALERLR